MCGVGAGMAPGVLTVLLMGGARVSVSVCRLPNGRRGRLPGGLLHCCVVSELDGYSGAAPVVSGALVSCNW